MDRIKALLREHPGIFPPHGPDHMDHPERSGVADGAALYRADGDPSVPYDSLRLGFLTDDVYQASAALMLVDVRGRQADGDERQLLCLDLFENRDDHILRMSLSHLRIEGNRSRPGDQTAVRVAGMRDTLDAAYALLARHVPGDVIRGRDPEIRRMVSNAVRLRGLLPLYQGRGPARWPIESLMRDAPHLFTDDSGVWCELSTQRFPEGVFPLVDQVAVICRSGTQPPGVRVCLRVEGHCEAIHAWLGVAGIPDDGSSTESGRPSYGISRDGIRQAYAAIRARIGGSPSADDIAKFDVLQKRAQRIGELASQYTANNRRKCS